jgi:hypothetical protein
MPDPIVVADRGARLAFSFEHMLRHHGGGSPGGVAHAFKVLERALPLLAGDEPVERRELAVRTAFGGPGARDGFELVTGAVSDGRYVLDAALARPERGLALERFVFALRYRERAVTLAAREGFVPEELIVLARRERRSAEEERRFAAVKREMAETVMAADAADVYERLD